MAGSVHRAGSSSSTPSFNKPALPATRTPSTVDFPGAFTTHPKSSKRHISVGQIMKGGFAETVSGSLNNVVGGVYSIVNYVNPLGSTTSARAGDHAKGDASDSGHSEAGDAKTDAGLRDTGGDAKTDAGYRDTSGDSKTDAGYQDSPLILQAPSAGTSVAADLDEHWLADANADNPESNRPPTPTKTFTRMLRFPAHTVGDPSMHASSAEYKQAVRNDPVSRNVSQRTGLQFRPGAEEKRRYMRRMSKAPQLEATPPAPDAAPARRSTSEQRRKRSTSLVSSAPSSQDDHDESDASADDDADTDAVGELDTAELEQFYQAAASTQRSDSKHRAIEPWRFISPRVKRVKRRVLWRLFLAQELNPAVYDEATTNVQSCAASVRANAHANTHANMHSSAASTHAAANSTVSSPVVSPQSARGAPPGSPRSQPPAAAGALGHPSMPIGSVTPRRDVASTGDTDSLRRRMLESATARADDATQRSIGTRDSSGRLRQRTPSVAPSVDSLNSAAAAQSLLAEPGNHKNAVWTMEFSVCGKYLAAGGQDGVVRVWRIAPFAREQEAEKRQQQQQEAEKRQQQGFESPASSAASPSSHTQAQLHPAGRTRAGSSNVHARQKSAMYVESADMMPFANAAPIAKGKHLRSFSVGPPMLPARAARPPALHADAEPQASPPPGAAAGEPLSAASGAEPDAAPTAQLHPMHAYELLEPVPFRSYVGHSADVLALSWSKNGFLLSASMDRTVRLWHPHRPECLCTFRHRDIVTSVAFNPRDDRLFISGSLDCRLRLWDIPARSVRHWTRLPEGQMVTSVAFTSPRGDRIVAGTYRGMCVFYSTDELAVQGRMHARSSRGRNAKGSKITGFACAPTGQMPAALLRRLLGSALYEALVAHPRLLVSSNDSRLRMFLPGARELERKYKGHANASSQAYARLSSDGRYIVSGSEDHNIYVWPVAQDNAATVATHPNSDHIRRAGRAAAPIARANASSDRPGSTRAEKHTLLASLFSRRRTQYEQTKHQIDPASASEEWESLDGKVEEKSIYEYFPAHDAAVSQALFVPAVTLQYLADHDDPIFSRRKMRRTKANGDVENVLPVAANATFGGGVLVPPDDDSDELRDAVEDMTSIIVSADTSGCIRVFRKDINVRRWHAGAGQNPSHSSLVKAKESVGSLTRVLTRDGKAPAEPRDFDTYTMTPGHTVEHRAPPSLSSQQHPSFWNRLGRRVSQKRNSSTFSGTPSAAADEKQNLHTRAVSGGPETVPLSLAVIAEASSSSLQKVAKDGAEGDVCAHCGNDKFIDFAVAPAAASGSNSSNGATMSISVCGKCKHVRNMPV